MKAPGSRGNVAALLEISGERRGPAAAILAPAGGTLWTFGDLAEASARLAGGLVDLGIGRGDRVLVLEPDPRGLYRLIVAVIWAGAAAMVPPLSLPLHRALRAAGDARPSAVIASLPLWPAVLAAGGLRNAPVRLTTGRWRFPGTGSVDALARHPAIAPASVAPDDPALVSFTTGSTGTAKSIARTHAVLRAQHDALAALRPLDEATVDLAGLPMLVMHNLGSGVTSAPAPRGAGARDYGRRIRSAMARTGAGSVAGFPHLFESALDGARPDELRQLRSIYVGGSRVRAELLKALKVAAPDATITVVYGSTEVEPIAAIGAEEYLDLLARHEPSDGVCVGSVMDGLELRVGVDAPPSNGAQAPVSTGRILVRGPRAAGAAGSAGWLDTGDLGRLGDDGRLWLLGRGSNLLGDVFPVDVERRVEALPWVDRAAVVGLQSGPAPRGLLAVQPRRWSDARARATWLEGVERLAQDHRWPLEETMLLRRLPVVVGAAAKVDDARLRRLAASRRRRPALRPT